MSLSSKGLINDIRKDRARYKHIAAEARTATVAATDEKLKMFHLKPKEASPALTLLRVSTPLKSIHRRKMHTPWRFRYSFACGVMMITRSVTRLIRSMTAMREMKILLHL